MDRSDRGDRPAEDGEDEDPASVDAGRDQLGNPTNETRLTKRFNKTIITKSGKKIRAGETDQKVTDHISNENWNQTKGPK